MPIKVKTEGAYESSEHIVSEESLRAQGIETDPEKLAAEEAIRETVEELISFQRWLQVNDAVDLEGATDENFESVARLYLGIEQ